jgi:hypothetical protein
LYCKGCEYDLRELSSAVCPECRQPFKPDDSRTYAESPLRAWRRRQFGWFTLALILLVLEITQAVRNYDTTAVVLVLMGLLGAFTMTTGIMLRRSVPNRRVSLLMSAPALVVAAMVSSLAVHMNLVLKGWPKNLGYEGFTRSLEVHANLAMFGFTILIMINLLPMLALIGFACTRRSQQWIYHLGIFTMSSCIGIGLISFAPGPFLNWWWD